MALKTIESLLSSFHNVCKTTHHDTKTVHISVLHLYVFMSNLIAQLYVEDAESLISKRFLQ